MKILVFGARDYEEPVIKKWSEEHKDVQVDIYPENMTEENVVKAKGYDGISIQQTNYIDNPYIYETLKDAGVKVIASRTAGVDMIHFDLVNENGLIVTNVPSYSPNAIAELAVTQAMNLLRKTPLVKKKVCEGDYRWIAELLGTEVRSITVGVIGIGKIGATAATLVKGLGANVIAFDQYPNSDLNDILTYKDSLEDLLKEADLITLHTPLLEGTKHMINKDTLAIMKDGAYIVNTGRGGLINTGDLIEALESGKIRAAALDTFETEGLFLNKKMNPGELTDPEINKLLSMEQVIFTHHLGFFTSTAIENIVYSSLSSAVEVIKTGTATNRVN